MASIVDNVVITKAKQSKLLLKRWLYNLHVIVHNTEQQQIGKTIGMVAWQPPTLVLG